MSYARKATKARAAWRQLIESQYAGRLRCMGCGQLDCQRGLPLAQHEIERRSQAPLRWAADCNYLLLGERCHAGPFDTMPHARQLAHKLVCDPDHYDLEAWLRLRDPELMAPNRVTQAEVAEWIPVISKALNLPLPRLPLKTAGNCGNTFVVPSNNGWRNETPTTGA